MTSSESKKIKNDDLSSVRTVTDKGFSVNNHGFYEVINILLKITDSAAENFRLIIPIGDNCQLSYDRYILMALVQKMVDQELGQDLEYFGVMLMVVLQSH